MSHIESLSHQRYRDGNEVTVSYDPASDASYTVRKFTGSGAAAQPAAMDLGAMRDSLAGQPELQALLQNRLDELQSDIAMDFDPSMTTVSSLFLRKRKHDGGRYLNEVCPCYSYVSLREHADMAPHGFRAGNGKQATLVMPVYLTRDHAISLREFFKYLFSQVADIKLGSSSQWHDLWVPDIIAHLINQAIVDFSKGTMTEPAIQFVLDAVRLLVFCCEVPALGHEARPQPLPPGCLHFPQMKSLMKKFVRGFIEDPGQRTRDKVPDLGDMLQWVYVLELVDDSLSWDDLLHAVVVELVRRQARGVCNHLMRSERLVRQTLYERSYTRWGSTNPRKRHRTARCVPEPQSATVLRFARLMPRGKLLSCWWEQSKVGCRVVLYSHAFYKTLVRDQGVAGFKQKYDKVLGAVYPEDTAALKTAQDGIMECSSLSEAFARLGYPLIDDDIHQLCLWAISASEGYHNTSQKDPFVSTRMAKSPAQQQRVEPCC